MKAPFYLYVGRTGVVRAVKNGSFIKSGEIEIKINLELPDALFQRPSLQADIVIPDEAALPKVINADVINRVEEAIRTSTDLEFNITVGEVQKDEEDL